MRSAGETKACARCGHRFPRRSGGVRYCGDACRLAVQTERRAASRAAAAEASDKLCNRRERKPKGQFHADTSRRDGLFPYCNDCRRSYTGSRPLTRDPRSKQQYDADRRAAMSAAETSAIARRTRLATTYNLSVDDYMALLDKQEGRCAICLACNTAVGALQEDPATIQAAFDYVTRGGMVGWTPPYRRESA